MAGAVQEVDDGLPVLGEVVGHQAGPLPTVQVHDPHAHPHGSRQRHDVKVVTLPVHGLNLLCGEGEDGLACSVHFKYFFVNNNNSE